MANSLTYNQLQVGDQWTSSARTVTEADIVNFAGMTGDFNPLHVDHHYARQTSFERPIAHGLLGLTWVAGLGSHSPNVQTLAFVRVRQWRFIRPIFVGDTLHVRTTVKELRPDGKKAGYVIWKRELINQDQVTVQDGLFETLVAASVDDAST